MSNTTLIFLHDLINDEKKKCMDIFNDFVEKAKKEGKEFKGLLSQDN